MKGREVMANKFQDIKNKKILIYGTGKVAERLLLEVFSDSQIIGIIDRVRFCGEKCGFPILMWEDLKPGDADIIVIASSQIHYQEIYQRIIEKCVFLGLQIYGANGDNLIRYYGLGINQYQNFQYYEKNAEELGRILEGYDVVSFDIFDTLIMRKTLEPADIFDIVEERLKTVGMILKGLKAIRRQAELASRGKNIYKIYDILQEITGISENWKNRILEEELKCEKDFIIGRQAIIDIFHKLIESGKKVYLVSDMYLTSEILADILKDVGIRGYEKIFVSCEYGVSKENGLFRELCKKIGKVKCIHIGDNEKADVNAAFREGLDAYGISSAYDMMRNSNLHYAIGLAYHSNDRNFIGFAISKLFNNPFSLYRTSGIVALSSLEFAGILMLAPLVVHYMALLFHKLKQREYDGIIFVARDEYFFKKLYDRLCTDRYDSVPSYYVCSSRKISIRSGMDSHKEIEIALRHVANEQPENILYELFGVKCPHGTADNLQEDKKSIYDYEKEIMEHSQKTRNNYIKYLNRLGIDLEKKYLLCELDGKGTSLYYLNHLFKQELDSLYMMRYHFMDDIYSFQSEVMYDIGMGCDDNSIHRNIAFVESIFSAPHPSAEDMEEGGIPVFAEEVRSEEQIKIMLKMQDAMEAFCEEYFRTMYISDKPMNRELPLHFLELFPYINYEGECKALYRGKLYDEMSQVYLDMMTGERIQQ